MTIQGRIHNGVVIFEGVPAPPEGALVTVTYPAVSQATPTGPKRRAQLPLVHTGEPGTLNLTNERIAEILDEEDAALARR